MANCVSRADAYCHPKTFRRWDLDYHWVGQTLPLGGMFTTNGWDIDRHWVGCLLPTGGTGTTIGWDKFSHFYI